MPPAAVVSPHAYLQAQARWTSIELAFWLASLLPFWLFPDYLVLASQIAITALFALSLDLILGYAGIVSLGHAAFFGLGAYTAGLAARYGWGEPISGLMLGAFVAGVVGYAASLIVSRFRHLALIMITLGMGLLLAELANSMHWLTGGTDGLQGVKMWPIFSKFRFDLYGYTAYTYSLVAAVMAGVAGALLAQTTETVSLEALGFQRSADVLVILILGGTGRLYGGLIGAIIFMVARDQFSGNTPQFWYFWIGILLVAVVMFLPNGILGGLAKLTSSWRSRM